MHPEIYYFKTINSRLFKWKIVLLDLRFQDAIYMLFQNIFMLPFLDFFHTCEKIRAFLELFKMGLFKALRAFETRKSFFKDIVRGIFLELFKSVECFLKLVKLEKAFLRHQKRKKFLELFKIKKAFLSFLR